MVFGSTKQCPQCKAKVKEDDRFCNSCGHKMDEANRCQGCGGAMRPQAAFCTSCGAGTDLEAGTCAFCGVKLKGSEAFCWSCGKPVPGQDKKVAKNRWVVQPGQFAARVVEKDLEGVFSKGLVIEPGTRALFILDGRHDGVIGPGKHDMGGLLAQLKNWKAAKQREALIVIEKDAAIAMTFQRVFTSDPIGLDLELVLEVSVGDPALFLLNNMQGKDVYTVNDIREMIEGELRQTLENLVRHKTARELQGADIRGQFELAISQNLQTTFERAGLVFTRLKIVYCKHQRLDKIKGVREDTFLMISEEEAKLDNKRRFNDLFNDSELEDLRADQMKLQRSAQVVELNDKLRHAANQIEKDDALNEDDLEKFLHDIGLGKEERKLLGEERIAELEHMLSLKGDLREEAKEHFLNRVDMENMLELKRLKLYEDQDREHGLADREIDHEIQNMRKRLLADLENSQEVFGEMMRQEEADFQQRLAQQKVVFDEQLRRQQLEHGQDMQEVNDALDLKNRMKEIKRRDKEDNLRIDRDHTITMGTHEQEVEDRKHRRELEKMAAMSEASVEALIAMAPSEQAKMLAELKKTEQLKGFTEEQILAMAAQSSPEVARAFQTKFQGLAQDKLEEMYKSMLTMQQQATEAQSKQAKEFAEMTKEMFIKGMESQSQMGRANVVFPTQVGGPVVDGVVGGALGVIVCRQCKHHNPSSASFCENCGASLRD